MNIGQQIDAEPAISWERGHIRVLNFHDIYVYTDSVCVHYNLTQSSFRPLLISNPCVISDNIP